MKYSGTRSSMSSMGIESIGLCIPINEAKEVIDRALSADTGDLGKDLNNGRNNEAQEENSGNSVLVGKPRLGVSVTTFNGAEMTNGVVPNGVYIIDVEEKSPAEKAGLQPGDVILEANGTVTPTFEAMSEVLLQLKAGDTVNLKIWRPEMVKDAGKGEISTSGTDMEIQVVLQVIDPVAQ